MARKPKPPPAPPQPPPEHVEDQQREAGEESFLDQALSEMPDLPPKNTPPSGDEPRPEPEPSDEPRPPRPATRASAEEPPKVKPGDEPPKSKGQEAPPQPQPPVEPTGEPEPTTGKAGARPVDKELEDRLAKIVPKPGQEEGYRTLKELIREHRGKAIDFEKKLTDAEKDREKLRKSVPSDEDRERHEQLAEYIRNVAIENDPDFQRKYNGEIKRVDGELTEFLKGAGMKSEILDTITARGGILKFAKSTEPADPEKPDRLKNEDGTPMTEEDFFTTYVFDRLSSLNKQRVTDMLNKADSVQLERTRLIQENKAKAPEYLKTRQEKIIHEFNTNAQNRIAEIVAELPDDLPRQIEEIPPTATKEERERIEKRNTAFKEADEYVTRMVMAVSAQDRAEVATYAAFGKYFIGERKEMQDRITELESDLKEKDDELDRIAKARRTGGPRGAPVGPQRQTPRDYNKLSDSEAIDQAL